MEVEAPASGVIRGLSADLDKALPVGSTVAWIEAEGEAGGHSPERRARPTSPLARILIRPRGRGRSVARLGSGEGAQRNPRPGRHLRCR